MSFSLFRKIATQHCLLLSPIAAMEHTGQLVNQIARLGLAIALFLSEIEGAAEVAVLESAPIKLLLSLMISGRAMSL